MNGLERYDALTQISIMNFLSDFQNIFLNVLTNRQLLELINKNMPDNIVFNQDLDDRVVGLYDGRCIKVIRELEGLYLRKVLFHEFIHVITKGYFSWFYDEYSEFIEGLTTLCEERFAKYYNIYQKRRRVNGYIPDLVREFNIATDDELLITFLKSPDYVFEKFYPLEICDGDLISRGRYFNTFNRFVEDNKEILTMAKDGKSDFELDPKVIRCEKDILFQYYSRCMIGEFEFSFEKLEEIYLNQVKPDIDMYIRFIKEEIKLGNLNIDEVDADTNLIELYKIKMNKEDFIDSEVYFENNELEWLAANYFGFGAYLNRVVNVVELSEHNVSLQEFYDKCDDFENHKSFYTKLMELSVYEKVKLDDLKGCRYVIGNEDFSSFTTKNSFVNLSDTDRFFNAIFNNDCYEINDCFIIDSDDNVKLIINDGSIFYPKTFDEVCDGLKDIENDAIKKYMEQYISVFKNASCIYTHEVFYYSDDLLFSFIINDGNDYYYHSIIFDYNDNKIKRTVTPLEFNGKARSIFNDDPKYFELKREF